MPSWEKKWRMKRKAKTRKSPFKLMIFSKTRKKPRRRRKARSQESILSNVLHLKLKRREPVKKVQAKTQGRRETN